MLRFDKFIDNPEVGLGGFWWLLAGQKSPAVGIWWA